jgi:hypothetical protein
MNRVHVDRETSTHVAFEAHFGVVASLERLRALSASPRDAAPVGVDATVLIIALWRLRLAATMSSRIPGETAAILAAIATFDAALPGLKRLRNVTMHFDNYALENKKRRNKIGDPPRLVGALDLWDLKRSARGFTWLEVDMDYDIVQAAARALYDAIQDSNNSQLTYED